ncbi:D-alanine--D-alanine ligase family protein [Arcanobacterium bovis]|uniref:D-alanine--D-alanine ligase n=1 Tax=Arcanobacterium bovis TaxID=2529275 RepID=A0A4Q9V0P3_9ACTO|nr:D-alanine--D-alanine ligase [Arcanobacterium bovis]TBW21026.1 D-alanine--D-alanine ligase [Arcanobacterium bovis]
MDRPLTVAILAGGLTHERDISMHSGRRVAGALRNRGVQVKVLDVDAQLLQRLDALDPDVVWPLVHGSTGEDGALQDLLQLAGYPYVGTEPAGCRLASDKAVVSSVLERAGVAVPTATALPQPLFREVGVTPVLDLIESQYGFPVVIKPAKGGSSLGLTIVENKAQLPGAMVDCFAYDDVALVQSFVRGREFGVAVIDLGDGDGPRVLPPVEVQASGPYDFDARYYPGRVEYFVPARVNEAELQAITDLALTVHKVLDLRHYSRTDVILDEAGKAWFIDVNTTPGMTETSIFPQAAAAYAQTTDRSVDDVYVDILRAAL